MTDSTDIALPDATIPQWVCAELMRLLAPLTRIAGDPAELDALLRTLGAAPSDEQRGGVLGSITNVTALVTQVQDLASQPEASFESVTRILALGQQAFDTVRALDTTVQSSPELAGIGRDVAERLFGNYLATAHPLLRSLAVLTTIIEDGGEFEPRAAVVRDNTVVRQPFTLDRFRFERISQLLRDPLGLFRTAYGTSIASAAEATALAQKLFPRLQSLAQQLGFNARPSAIVADSGATAPAPSLTVQVNDVLLGATADAGVTAILSPAEHGNLGLVVIPFGTLDLTRTFGTWQFALALNAGTNAFAYGPQGLTVLDALSQTTVGAMASATLPPATSGPRFVLGSPTGTRLEIGSAAFKAAASFSADHHSLSFDASTTKSAFIVAAGDGDGFLAQILPAGGLRAEFDLGIGWSNDRGFALHGSASLEADLPVTASIAGLTLSGVHVGLRAANDRVDTEISATFSLSLGPVYARVDRVGVRGTLGFPANGGNLGPVDVSLGFKAPSGVGISIDAKGVLSGGGFLYHDEARSLYAGALQLSLQNLLTLKAFGLIATRMPDGSPGYSLIVFITAEDFRAIPLGFGFNLLGIGGMVAINRTFDVDVLREGLKNDTLASLLFPRDPVGNAPALINALAIAFPARRGSYLLGLLARIGWFTPTLVLLDLALIMEFGNRTRLLALGRVSAMLPSRENDLVRLNLDAMGVIDFDARTAAIDAVLVDSRLVHKFVITGAGALRAGFGGGPDSTFVLAIGGLNPHFAAPDNFPTLARVTIALASGNNPRLTCEAYFAITANTLQFGARASLYASAGGFSIEGDVGYDVLVQWVPLHFLAEFHARLQLKRGSTCLFMLEVKGELEGPRPLRLSGKATFKILFCHFSVRFDTTLVSGEPPPLPPAVDVRGELAKALLTPQSWTTQNANNAAHGVALRSLPNTSTALVLDPLGQLTIKQQVVPLNTQRDIETFGGAPVAGDRRFSVSATLGTDTAQLPKAALSSSFAPSQFFNMNDDERLTAPSFETYEAGCVFGSSGVKIDENSGARIAASLGYDTFIIDVDAGTSAPPPATAPAYTLTADRLTQFARSGAAGRAPVRSVAQARFANSASTPPATQPAPSWTIVPKTSGAAASVAPATRTWSEYQAALKSLNRGKASWQLLPTYEVQS